VCTTTTTKEQQLTSNLQQEGETCRDVVASAPSLGLNAPSAMDDNSPTSSSAALEGLQQPQQLLSPKMTHSDVHDATNQPAAHPLSGREDFINKITAHTAAILPIKIQHRKVKTLQQGQTPRRSRHILLELLLSSSQGTLRGARRKLCDHFKSSENRKVLTSKLKASTRNCFRGRSLALMCKP
jgi:hypothetical protein